MLKVAITGNMGSGKTTVCSIFKILSIPVFNADEAAAYELEHNSEVVRAVKSLFGEDIYNNCKADRQRIASQVFNSPEKLQALNAVSHPATIEHFKRWLKKQDAPYIIKEAAILFESGTDIGIDKIITVTAPEIIRIERIQKRNPQWTDEQIQRRLKSQMAEDEKIKRSHFVINNDGTQSLIEQVLHIHQELISK